MANTQETHAHIIAEMRGNEFDDPHLNRDGIIGARRLARGWADRLEAAHKRESGDTAKLREAAEKTRATLEEALQILNGISDEEAGRLNARLEDVADTICEVTQWIIPDALATTPIQITQDDSEKRIGRTK